MLFHDDLFDICFSLSFLVIYLLVVGIELDAQCFFLTVFSVSFVICIFHT